MAWSVRYLPEKQALLETALFAPRLQLSEAPHFPATIGGEKLRATCTGSHVFDKVTRLFPVLPKFVFG